ncbi:MAG: hypothetical protein ACW99A_23945 [Candidatus Kariarchaeaceae archaeon]
MMGRLLRVYKLISLFTLILMIINFVPSLAFNASDYTVGVNEGTTITHQLIEQKKINTNSQHTVIYNADYYVRKQGSRAHTTSVNTFEMNVGDRIKYNILSIEDNEISYSAVLLNESDNYLSMDGLVLYRGYFTSVFTGGRIIVPIISSNFELVEENLEVYTKNDTHFTVRGIEGSCSSIDRPTDVGTCLTYLITFDITNGIVMAGRFDYKDNSNNETAFATLKTIEIDKAKSSDDNGLNFIFWYPFLAFSFIILIIKSKKHDRLIQ